MSNTDKDLGYVYISEAFTDSNIKNINTVRNTAADLFYITFDTNLQDFDVKNRNQRYYDASNIMECIKSEKIQSLLRTGGWFGEFDHPTPMLADEKLSPERIQNVPPLLRAFKIMDPHLEGNILKAKIQSAQTDVGVGFAKETLAGWIPQFSARAIASMIMKHNKPYVQVRKLITYDAPWYPSHEIAHMTSKPEIVNKSFTESVHDSLGNVKEKINDVLIPLKEILRDVGKTDINTGLILEAFDLDEKNLCGFDSKREHIIIRDENNVIYGNIDPSTVKRVNDFYNSFI